MTAIIVRNLNKSFPLRADLFSDMKNFFLRRPKKKIDALSNINLEIKRGEILGIIGHNGAGKTTLLKILGALLLPESGEVFICGKSTAEEEFVKQKVGVSAWDERSFYWRLTGRQNLQFFATLKGMSSRDAKSRLKEIVAELGMEEFIDRRFEGYSAGMRQTLNIARALISRPEILLLDEPTRSLDPTAQKHIKDIIRRLNKSGVTVFYVTHRLEEVMEICDRVCVLNHGKIQLLAPVREVITKLKKNFIVTVQHPEFRELAEGLQRQFAKASIEELIETETHKLQVKITSQDLNEALKMIYAEGGIITDISTEGSALEGVLEAEGLGPPPAEAPEPPKEAYSPTPKKRPFQNAFVETWQMILIACAFWKRDFIEESSYKLSFLLTFFSVAISCAIYFFLGRFIDQSGVSSNYLSGRSFFEFLVLGIAFFNFQVVALGVYSSEVRNGQVTGTLEAMFSCPTPLPWLLICSTLWEFTQAFLFLLVYLVLGSFLGMQLIYGNFLTVAFIMILGIIAFSTVGILSASFILAFKRGNPVGMVFGGLSRLFGGVYYPLSVLEKVLPWWIVGIAWILPVTPFLMGIRKALLENKTPLDMPYEIGALGLFIAIMLPLTIVALNHAVRLAKREGTLSHY